MLSSTCPEATSLIRRVNVEFSRGKCADSVSALMLELGLAF